VQRKEGDLPFVKLLYNKKLPTSTIVVKCKNYQLFTLDDI